ncbi:MAG: diacylglycerol kinase [Patescibacteria group bacterium]
MPLSLKRLQRSFKYAMHGLVYVFKNEQNFRIQLTIGLVVILAILFFKVQAWQAIVLLMLITLVLVLELINTIFERIIDILKPRIHSYVEIIKDIMAAAVLIASFGATVIALLIFLPYFLALF